MYGQFNIRKSNSEIYHKRLKQKKKLQYFYIDAKLKKTLDKIQHLFTILFKTFKKGIDRNFLNMMKSLYRKTKQTYGLLNIKRQKIFL